MPVLQNAYNVLVGIEIGLVVVMVISIWKPIRISKTDQAARLFIPVALFCIDMYKLTGKVQVNESAYKITIVLIFIWFAIGMVMAYQMGKKHNQHEHKN